jgi:hypothetical protein
VIDKILATVKEPAYGDAVAAQPRTIKVPQPTPAQKSGETAALPTSPGAGIAAAAEAAAAASRSAAPPSPATPPSLKRTASAKPASGPASPPPGPTPPPGGLR